MRDRKDLKLAVLIDADNVPYYSIKGMLDEIAKIGVPAIKRIYGDWTKPTVSGWKPLLLEHAITPIQQYSYTVGKNATDSAMIIDAMDILHSNEMDGFCLVSSDSDFTRLATRLRESGMLVIGIGERKTPNPFIVACDKFIYIEIINANLIASEKPVSTKKDGNIETVNKELIELIKTTINDLSSDEDEWVFLGDVGNLIMKKRSDFDSRNYGFPKLTPLIKSLNKYFETREKEVDNNNHIRHIFVRIKQK